MAANGVPGLRPIETPREVNGESFFSPSPRPKQNPYADSGGGGGSGGSGGGASSSSSSEWQSIGGSTEADVSVLLPQHRANANGTANGTALRRFGNTLASPFKSPTQNGRGGRAKFFDEDENILQMPGRREFHASPRSMGEDRLESDPTNKVLAVLAFLLTGVCLYYANVLMAPKAGFTFLFRPPPPDRTPYQAAVSRFRAAYKTTRGGVIGFDDPLNPGSIFLVLDKVEDHRKRGDFNNFVNSQSNLFARTKKFALGMEKFLLGVADDSEKDDLEHKFIEVTSFYSVLTDGLPHVAGNQYATKDGFTTLIEVKFAVPKDVLDGPDLDEYVAHVVGSVRQYVDTRLPSGIGVGYTGLPLFRADLRNGGRILTDSPPTTSLDEILTSNAPSLVAYRRLADRFGWGIIAPYRIVFDASNASMDTDPGFRIMHSVMNAFTAVDLKVETPDEVEEEEKEAADGGIVAVNLDSIPQRIEDGNMDGHLAEVMDELYGKQYMAPEEEAVRHDEFGHAHMTTKPPTRTVYNGIPFLRNNMVPYPLYLGARICREKQKQHCTIELLHYLTAMTDAMTAKDRSMTYVTATLGVDPFSEDGVAWLLAARAKLDELQKGGSLDGYRVSILGGASLEYDALQRSDAKFEPPAPSVEPVYILVGSAVLLLVIFGYRISVLNRVMSKEYEHKKC